jgi:hypothetical protein
LEGHVGICAGEIHESPDEWFSRIHPRSEHVRLALSTSPASLTPHFESEHRMQHKDGSYRWVLTAISRCIKRKTAQETAQAAARNHDQHTLKTKPE